MLGRFRLGNNGNDKGGAESVIVCRSVSGIIQEFPDADSEQTLPDWAAILVKRGKLAIVEEDSPEEEVEDELPEPPAENASKDEWEIYIQENFEPAPDTSRMTKVQMVEWVRKNS